VRNALDRGTVANTLAAEFDVHSFREAHALAASIRTRGLLPGARVIWAPQENFTESLLLLGDALGFEESDYRYKPLRVQQSTWQPSQQQVHSIRAQTALDSIIYEAGFHVFTQDVAKLRHQLSPAVFEERRARLIGLSRLDRHLSKRDSLKAREQKRPRFPNCDAFAYRDSQYESLIDPETFRIRVPPGCERQQPWAGLLKQRVVQT
jgi:hypothetical protein